MFDGTGYPDGLRGEEIPLAARVFSVVDAFDAMTADRPYRAALPPDEAVAELQRMAGTQFDPEVVRVFAPLASASFRRRRLMGSMPGPANPGLEARMRDLGGFIRDQRRTARLSLRKLSELAGISNPYLSQIERGLRKPSAEILQAIARALRISAETLYVRAGILEARDGDRRPRGRDPPEPDALRAPEAGPDRHLPIVPQQPDGR